MKKTFIILSVFFLLQKIKAQVYPHLNLNLLSHLDPEKDATGFDGRKYSGCWGWEQSDKNKEYAIIGTSSKTYFIDVSVPTNPIICDSVKAKRNGCTWREIKTYQNYCYIVSDDPAPNSFQIVDMKYLPDSVHVVYDGNSYFERVHTVFIDKDKMYCGGVTSNVGEIESMCVYSLATPSVPLLIRKLSDDIPSIGYVHDMYVNNDTIFASCGGQGLFIMKLLPSNTFSLLASYSGYPYAGYNHSSWLTENKKILVFTDEVPTGLPVKLIDVSDLSNINLLGTLRSHDGATAHNPYIVSSKWCWVSSYQDGLYLYNISNPDEAFMYGFFDTHPQHGLNDNYVTNAYKGNWGAYPFLKSKIIIACDMQNGIFILEGDEYYKTNKEPPFKTSIFSIYPNPINENLIIYLLDQKNKTITFTITNLLGQVISENRTFIDENKFKYLINVTDLSSGIYFITITGDGISETKKIIIQN